MNNSTKFLEPLAWAPRADTCPWLYGQASLPHLSGQVSGLSTLKFYSSLEVLSDFSVFPLLCSPGERGQAEALDPHHAGVSYPVPPKASRAPGRRDAQVPRDRTCLQTSRTSQSPFPCSFGYYSLCHRHCKSSQALHSEPMTKLQKAILSTGKKRWNLYYV